MHVDLYVLCKYAYNYMYNCIYTQSFCILCIEFCVHFAQVEWHRGLSGPALNVTKILNIYLTFAKIKEYLNVVRHVQML